MDRQARKAEFDPAAKAARLAKMAAASAKTAEKLAGIQTAIALSVSLSRATSSETLDFAELERRTD